MSWFKQNKEKNYKMSQSAALLSKYLFIYKKTVPNLSKIKCNNLIHFEKTDIKKLSRIAKE